MNAATDQTITLHISDRDLVDAQARGEGFFFKAGQPVPTAAEFAAMFSPCTHPETFELDEDDALTDAFAGDIQCTECADVLVRRADADFYAEMATFEVEVETLVRAIREENE